MKKLFISLEIVLILFLCKPIYAKQGIIETDRLDLIIPNAITSSVSLFTEGINGNWYSCSGVVIKNTPTESIVLTAKHCLNMKNAIYVEGLKAETIGIAVYDDIGYIKLDKFIPYKTPAILSNHIPKKNDRLAIVGYPLAKLYTNKGTMFIETRKEYIANVKILKGCSGGGVFNIDGELIGIMFGYIPLTNSAFLEKLQDIDKFIKINKLLE